MLVLALSTAPASAPARAANAELLPRSTDWAHNSRWDNPNLCGQTFWVTLHASQTVGGGATAVARLGHDRRYALYSMPTLEKNLKASGDPSSAALTALFVRAERGEIPIMGHTFFTYAESAKIIDAGRGTVRRPCEWFAGSIPCEGGEGVLSDPVRQGLAGLGTLHRMGAWLQRSGR